MKLLERRRGRPRKFAAPSRAVTLTLPESVIAALGSVDHDLSRAIVRLAGPSVPITPTPAAELSRFGKHAVIVVHPTRALAKRGIDLVPLPDGRALIALEGLTSIAELELTLEDGLADQHLSPADREIFESVVAILRSARRSGVIRLLQRSIIVFEARRPTRRRKSNPSPPAAASRSVRRIRS